MRGPQRQANSAASSQLQRRSRADHVTAKAMPVEPWSGVSSSGPSGVREAARVHSLVRNRRDPSAWPASGKDQGYKPMVKALGGQRESDGVVVPLIGVQHNAPGGKGPNFDHARSAGKCKGMAGVSRSNSPGKSPLAVADDEPLGVSPVKVRQLQRVLWAAAKQSEGRRFHVLFDEKVAEAQNRIAVRSTS